MTTPEERLVAVGLIPATPKEEIVNESTATKVCPHCGETKALSEYPKSKSTKDGLDKHCRPCVRAWRRGEWRVNGKAEVHSPAPVAAAFADALVEALEAPVVESESLGPVVNPDGTPTATTIAMLRGVAPVAIPVESLDHEYVPSSLYRAPESDILVAATEVLRSDEFRTAADAMVAASQMVADGAPEAWIERINKDRYVVHGPNGSSAKAKTRKAAEELLAVYTAS